MSATKTKSSLPKFDGAVRSAMTTDVKSAPEGATLSEVADQMADENLRRVIIVNNSQCVVGVVSQRDVLRRYLALQQEQAAGKDPSVQAVRIGALITRERPVTVTPEIPLSKAAMVLATNKIGCLPVVGARGELMGVLTTTDLLRHLSGGNSARLESAFQIYSPSSENRVKSPAYVRKSTGELVIPIKSIDKPDICTKYTLLGYDPPSGRILVKFIGDEPTSDAAMRTRSDDGCLIVASSGFVNHYNLAGKTSAFDVTSHKGNRYLVLTPRQVN